MLLTAPAQPSLYDLSFDQVRDHLVKDGVRPAHAPALWRSLHQEVDPTPFAADPDYPPPLRRWLDARSAEGWMADLPDIRGVVSSSDGLTHKLLLRLMDGQEIETVVMAYDGRHTACISTQAGCALGCVFCATGQMGFARHLRPAEIVGQALVARRFLHGRGIAGPRNLVLMGMGEPLHNYDAVMHALGILCDNRGMNLGPSRISVSTVGLVPAIRRFADEGQPYNLAVSLHAADDEERSRLLPVNRKWPLAELMAACRYFQERTGRRIFVGWTLIAGHNDSPDHARRVVDLLRGLDVHVNLIRLNPTQRFAGTESSHSLGLAFQRVVREAGIPCTLRQRRGIDVDAGCGQLTAARRPRAEG